MLLVGHPFVGAATSSSLVQMVDTGCIDWSAGIVRVTWVGFPVATDDDPPGNLPAVALERARQMAQARLMTIINAIRINAALRVADRMDRSTAFRDGLITLRRNATVARQEYLANGNVEIALIMHLTGGFAQLTLPEEIRQVDSVTTMNPDGPIAQINPTAADVTQEGAHTGLILDATGIGASPSMVPVVVDEAGEVVYGPAFVSREFVVSRGMCGFTTSLAAARDDKRVGGHPIIVKAIRTHSTGTTDLVIANTDAARLRSSVMHLGFMKACRVIIVMDPAPSL